MQDDLDLADWRRQVAALYALPDVESWRAGRDRLYREHPQSPVPPSARAAFAGCRWYAITRGFRIEGRADFDVDAAELAIDTGGEDGEVRYRRAARIAFEVGGRALTLTLFRQLGYGGGLFLPFRDLTSGGATYGGGRYLTDTVKATHAGGVTVKAGSDRVILDFNYAYNPSCAYDPRWACPLAPPENRVEVAIEAGEQTPVL